MLELLELVEEEEARRDRLAVLLLQRRVRLLEHRVRLDQRACFAPSAAPPPLASAAASGFAVRRAAGLPAAAPPSVSGSARPRGLRRGFDAASVARPFGLAPSLVFGLALDAGAFGLAVSRGRAPRRDPATSTGAGRADGAGRAVLLDGDLPDDESRERIDARAPRIVCGVGGPSSETSDLHSFFVAGSFRVAAFNELDEIEHAGTRSRPGPQLYSTHARTCCSHTCGCRR